MKILTQLKRGEKFDCLLGKGNKKMYKAVSRGGWG